MSIFNLLWPFFFFFLCVTTITAKSNDIANTTEAPPPPLPSEDARTAQFKPGIAVTVGIFTTIFSITFLLLLYVKHCKRDVYSISSSSGRNHPLARKNSGIDRKVVESLPIFRFSSLRGQKDGLECAVCLNRFDADEVLRLLPKCKHAFHVECVDVWLEAHSTCPLCRYRVDPEDVLLVDTRQLCGSHGDQTATPRVADQYQGKGAPPPEVVGGLGRVSGRHSSAEGGSLEIIVENPGEDALRGRASLDSWNSRRRTGVGSRRRDFRCRSLDSWRARRKGAVEIPGRKSRSGRRDGQLPVQGDKHRLEHRIIVSGGGGEGEEGEGSRRRWSDVEAADLLYLRSEMIIGGEGEGSGSVVVSGRSASEITGVSRSGGGRREERERRREGEGVVRRWLDWISQPQRTPVNSAASAAAPSSSSSASASNVIAV